MKAFIKIILNFILITITILYATSFISCRDDTLNPSPPQQGGETHSLPPLKKVMLIDDACVFNENVAKLNDVLNDFYHDDDASTQKSIAIGHNGAMDVFYVESKRSDIRDQAIYQTADKNFECRYDSRTGKLLQLTAAQNLIAIPENLTTEAEYRAWVEQLLAIYEVGDLSGYQYTCETSVRVETENSVGNDRYSYFYTDLKTNESISYRYFTYTKYINNRPTTDRIYVSLSRNRVHIKFDQHEFTNEIDTSLSDDQIKEILDSFLAESLDKDQYDLLSAKIKETTWRKINGEICVDLSIEMEMQKKETSEMQFVVLIWMVIFPNL